MAVEPPLPPPPSQPYDEVLRVVEQFQDLLAGAEEDIFMQGHRAPRTFVCQGCGIAVTVLYGTKVTCGCGVTSSAELLPPGT